MTRFLLFVIISLVSIPLFAQNNSNTLLPEIDKTIENNSYYTQRKEHGITQLKAQLKHTLVPEEKDKITQKLYNEYQSYQSDSALVYAQTNFQIAENLNDPEKLNQTKFNLVAIMGTLGMYKEGIDILNAINIASTPNLKGSFYSVSRVIYGQMADNASSQQEKEKYLLLSKQYRDLCVTFYDPNSTSFIIAKADWNLDNKKPEETLDLLLPFFPKIKQTDSNRAIISYIISQAYKLKKDRSKEKKWLCISALSDLQLAKKEYISLRSLAFLLYEDGDIERAYTYIKRSLDDAVICNARLRTYEISKMLPIISESYQQQNKTNRYQLMVFLISASFLVLILLALLFLLFRQMKKLSKAKSDLSSANDKLSELNVELNTFNEKLNLSNNTLTEANYLKEIYIGRYMDQCSDYLGKLDEYQRKLNVLATTGKINDLLSAVKSKEYIENELKEFYANFDKTFLQLFPNFIHDFNALLIPTDTIQPKEGEQLNTELRIFALIRLGIKDSAKIAVFLRYSISTIYNYRSQLKNKSAGPREEFEEKVMQIGTSNK
ncbi:hypothetical protein DOS84_00815 [Flavobacterium aquariorum]|uniref:DUF6377 domain-containing protein n=1 Tax=Flavobacterium aquariorum TaxID=2217670 RepID=A0A2W7UP09_9FLAO|nr:DUF6377 domain-containing protein [Flavobacterium aquariorum]PZX95145.1 hypothetical protein DOS84_00815 [Flavobacterium aquariorum]